VKKNNKERAPEIARRDNPTGRERLEDVEDLKTLKAMRKRPLKFRKLDDFLQERRQGA
jgi:hypothetical protein